MWWSWEKLNILFVSSNLCWASVHPTLGTGSEPFLSSVFSKVSLISSCERLMDPGTLPARQQQICSLDRCHRLPSLFSQTCSSHQAQCSKLPPSPSGPKVWLSTTANPEKVTTLYKFPLSLLPIMFTFILRIEILKMINSSRSKT